MKQAIRHRAVTWLSAATGVQGMWAFFAPRSFFEDFPVPGFEWVSTLGEFNDHLMRDFGAALIGLAVVGVLVGRRRGPLRAVLLGYVVFGSLHLAYHLTTAAEFTPGSFVAQIGVLSALVLIPAALVPGAEREGD